MAERRSFVRALGAPLGVGLLAAAGVAYYSLVWVPDQEQYFTNRNLRLLASLGASVQAGIDNLDNVLDNAAPGVTDADHLTPYFNTQVPGLIVDADASRHAQKQKGTERPATDPPTMTIRPDEGTFFLELGYQSKSSGRPIFVKTRVDGFVHPGQILRDFDALVIARASNGQVIYQNPRVLAETQLTFLSSLTSVGGGQPIDPSKLGKVSTVEEVALAGAAFKLFSEPLQLSYPAIDREGAPETWIVCGLTRSARFKAESRAMPLTYVLWFTLAIVLLFFSHPFIKLFTLGPATRLRARDPVYLTVTTFVSTGLITIGLLQGNRTLAALGTGSSGRLERFAAAVNDHFKSEQAAVWRELAALERSVEADTADLLENDAGSNAPPVLKFDVPDAVRAKDRADSRCVPEWACRTNILVGSLPLSDYPYFQFATWSDDRGQQRLKWTTRRNVTPFLKLEESGVVPFYREVTTARLWHQEARGISTFPSPNTGETLTIFWHQRPRTSYREAAVRDGSRELTLSALATTPLSLVGPLVAGDLQYAVIDREGVVLFHSDAARNLNENFLRECDDDPELRALIHSAGTGSLVTRYAGRRHQLYVRPLDLQPTSRSNEWSLVAFQSLEPRETLITEAASLASILFLAYGGILAALWALLACLWSRYPSRWLWPLESRSTAYRIVVTLNAILFLTFFLFFLAIPAASSAILLLAAVGIGLIAPAFALMKLSRPTRTAGLTRPTGVPGPTGPIGPSGPSWHTLHLMAVTSLLIVTAVLPAMAFFKVAHDLETELMIRREQLTLVRRVRDWQVAVVEKYRDVRGHRRVLTSLEPSCPRSEKDTERYWDYSCHSSFGTLTLTLPTASNPPFSGDINPPRSSSLSSRVVAVLGAIRPSYNVIASEAGSLTTREAWGAFTTNLVSDGQQEVSLDKDGISARTLWTPWTPGLPTWGSQIGWLGRVILLCAGLSGWCAVLFGAVRAMSRKLFLLDSGPLCGTRRSYVDGTDPAFDNALSTLEGSMGGSSSRAAAELVREECSAWPQLRAIAVGLVADLRAAPDGSETTPERLLEEIAARGESVYRALWSACTCAEKLVLVQLADEGIVNPGTRPVIHRLMGRDLVAQDPHPRVMTQGFSAFVRAALPRQTVGKWEQVDQAIPWQTIISTTVVAALAFLFVAQRDVASAWMAYLTGASATLPALFKLVGGLKFPSDSPEA